ncbi:hypothetical protein [Bradyrhizobium neotropicale]|uniref:hypothetical protein n=1 Tax=Bradyrhizobium neotropicale TaxID=1497615 RepID=UPI001AD6CE91|nr:hypothetical protein [Bradyrhizobium neotropicale]MBO4222054.1 hypothetical protein [Bradyrhizobium neotropicale]
MRRLILAAAFSAVAFAPALAKPVACTTENMAKSTASMNTMPEGPGKAAMAKSISKANSEMSKGNMRGACKHYLEVQAAK